MVQAIPVHERLKIVLKSPLVHDDLKRCLIRELQDDDVRFFDLIAERVIFNLKSGFPLPPNYARCGSRTIARYLWSSWRPYRFPSLGVLGEVDETCPHIPLSAPQVEAIAMLEDVQV